MLHENPNLSQLDCQARIPLPTVAPVRVNRLGSARIEHSIPQIIAAQPPPSELEPDEDDGWDISSYFFDVVPCWLISLLVHVAMLLVLTMFFLTNLGEGTIELEVELVQHSIDELEVDFEIEAPNVVQFESEIGELIVDDESLPAVQLEEYENGPSNWGTGSGHTAEFGELVSRLKKEGLDVAIVFDSTGSMSYEIHHVRDQLQRISETLLNLIPSARISVCKYRDDRAGDKRADGVQLTDDIIEIVDFLYEAVASGGGDTPESVDDGLEWAITKNSWRPSARKVILIFGDAPPHSDTMNSCVEMSERFYRKESGVVSTVTCRQPTPLKSFVEIANAGNGEAFLANQENMLMNQLIVLVFGSEHQSSVENVFDLPRNLPDTSKAQRIYRRGGRRGGRRGRARDKESISSF